MGSPSDIAAEITQTCLAMRVRLLGRVVTRLYALGAAEHGLTVPQGTLLAAIVDKPGARAADLTEALAYEKSTLSRNLRQLMKLGLIERRPGRGRDQHLFATAEGAAKVVAMHEAWRAAQDEAEALVGEHAEALHALVARVSPEIEPSAEGDPRS